MQIGSQPTGQNYFLIANFSSIFCASTGHFQGIAGKKSKQKVCIGREGILLVSAENFVENLGEQFLVALLRETGQKNSLNWPLLIVGATAKGLNN